MCRRGTQIYLPYSLLAALAPTLAGQLQLLGPRSSCQPEPGPQAGVGPGPRVSHGPGLQESTNQDPGRVLVQRLGTTRPRGAPRARAGSPRWTRTTGARAGATQWQCRRAQAAAGSHGRAPPGEGAPSSMPAASAPGGPLAAGHVLTGGAGPGCKCSERSPTTIAMRRRTAMDLSQVRRCGPRHLQASR
jgi:hypothetical protein